MRKASFGLFAALVILGCGGAGEPYVPYDGNGGGGGGGGGNTTFNISVTPEIQTVDMGDSATYTISVNEVNVILGRATKPVTLSVSGLPNDATATFSPSATVNPTPNGTPITLVVQTQQEVFADKPTMPGSYDLVISGTDGVDTRSVTVQLDVVWGEKPPK